MPVSGVQVKIRRGPRAMKTEEAIVKGAYWPSIVTRLPERIAVTVKATSTPRQITDAGFDG